MLKLTPQQVAAAKARGFVLFPATQGQIDRMTMQRRVFDVDGKPHVVSRDGLYFETHATLAPMIADAATLPEPQAAPVVAAPAPTPAPVAAPAPAPAVVATPVAVAEAAPAASTAPAPAPAPASAPGAPSVAEAAPTDGTEAEADAAPKRAPRRRLATKPEAEAPGAEPRKPTRRRTMVERAEELFAATAEPAAPAEPASPHTLSLPVDDSPQGTEAAARRRQRATEAPRWQVAGALRRGRQPRAT